jgi:hypothetical protein
LLHSHRIRLGPLAPEVNEVQSNLFATSMIASTLATLECHGVADKRWT